jgi:large subunit ribosomal protein L21
VHPQSGNRPVLRTPPGRLPLARLVSTEELARVRALLRSGGDGGGDGGGSGGEDDAVATAAAAAAGAPPPVPPSRRWVTKTERTSSLRFLRCRKLGLRAHRLLFPPASVADPAAARFAVVALGGRQYKVSPGDVINAERLPRAAVGDALTLVPLLVGSRDTTLVGRPTVAGAAVRLVVQEHVQDAKVVVFKKKRRKRYQKLQGHRRELTRLRVEAVDVDLAAY